MRVAYLVNQYPKTSHTFVRREIEALERCGVEVLRFAIRPVDEPLVDPADCAEQERTHALLAAGHLALLGASISVALGHPLRFLRALVLAVRLGWRSERGVLRHVAYLAEACLLLRRLSASPVAHVHAHFGTNSTAVALLCRALGGPSFSFTAHGTESFDAPERIGLPLKIEHARFVVAVSEHGRAQLLSSCRTSRGAHIHVVRTGVDRTFLEASEEPVPAAPRLLCVARWSPEKGLHVLLEAAAQLAREGRAFELDLVGDGALRPRLEESVARLGLGGHVRLLGWRSNADVRAHLLSARAVVLPSLGEGLPVVLTEALALGRPVIATAVGGVSELVETGVDGWLVPPGSVPDLARALRDALDAAPAELERMGRAGRERVHARHDAAVEAARLAHLFHAANGATSAGGNGVHQGAPSAAGARSEPSSRTLGSLARAGTIWTLLGYGASQVLRLGGNLVLSYLLAPEHFGVMVLVNVLIQGLTMFSDIGIGPSIIHNRRGDDRDFLDTAWTLQALRGVLLWLAACAIGPIAAGFYTGEPELAAILPIAGVTAAIAGFNSTKIFTTNRHMLLGRRTVIELVSQVVGVAVMIGWALVERSVWALVAGGVATSLVKMGLSHVVLEGPVNRPRWEPEARREMFTFGKWIFVSTLITFLALQIDRLMLGKLVPSNQLGIYGFAQSLASLPTQVGTMLAASVVFPLLATSARSDVASLRAELFRVRSWFLPCGILTVLALALFSPAFFRAFYDERYEDAGWIAAALAVPAWFLVLSLSSDRALLALGDTRSLALANGVNLVGKVIGCTIGYRVGGLLGFVFGLALGNLAGHAVVQVALARKGISIWKEDLLQTGKLVLLGALALLLPDRLDIGMSAAARRSLELAVAVAILLPLAWRLWSRLRREVALP